MDEKQNKPSFKIPLSEQQSTQHIDLRLQKAINALKENNFVEAKQHLEKFIDDVQDHPHLYMAHFYLGRIYQQSNQLEEAKASYQTSISANPNYVTAHNNLANVFKSLGDSQSAQEHYEKAIQCDPNYDGAHYNLGNLHLQNNEIEKANECYLQAVKANPERSPAWWQLGVIAMQQQRIDQALNYFSNFQQLNPKHGEVNYKLGSIYQGRNELGNAIQAYQTAIQLGFENSDLYNNLGAALHLLSHSEEEIIKCYRKALQFDPNSSSVYNNLGNTLKKFKKLDDALDAYKKAISFDPDLAIAYYNIGSIYHEQKKFLEAVEILQTCLDKDPTYSLGLGIQINALQYLADWDQLKIKIPELIKLTEEELKENKDIGLTNFGALMLPVSQKMLYDMAVSRAQHLYTKQIQISKKSKTGHERLRIGYISPDFSEQHPVGLLFNDICKHHDRKKYEIFGYGLREFKDKLAKEIENTFDHFESLTALSDREAAEKIANDEIDILIDLAGYTKSHRLGVLALQPASIQCQTLGYPGTIGAEFIQYQITTRTVVPENLEPFFTEKLLLLPEAHWASKGFNKPEQCLGRKNLNLPEDKFIFCCFNTVQRIDSTVFNAWMHILKNVPNSVLWLNHENDHMVKNLQRYTKEADVDPERLIFSKYEAMTARWRHELADLWLDTFTLSGGTAGMLCAWAGLPVLTMAGETQHSRTGAGIWFGADMTDLIVDSIEDYQERAIYLATHPKELKKIREKLLKQRETSALFNPKRFIKHLEKSYQMIWNAHQKNEPLQNISVPKIDDHE